VGRQAITVKEGEYMYKRGLVAGVVLLVFGLVANWFLGVMLPSLATEYQNIAIFRPWDDPLMTLYFGHPIIVGVVLSYLWERLKIKSPIEFARFYFVAATIPSIYSRLGFYEG